MVYGDYLDIPVRGRIREPLNYRICWYLAPASCIRVRHAVPVALEGPSAVIRVTY